MNFAHSNQRAGSILLMVLVVVVMLTLTSVAFYDWSFSEYKAADVGERQLQTNLAAESGIEYLRYLMTLDEATVINQGGRTNNPTAMQAVLTDINGEVPLQPGLRFRYAVVSPVIDSYGEFAGYRMGIEDESARLNLNTVLVADARNPEAKLGRTLLMSLPGMTESIADAILDWIDEDDEPREFGCERDYYTGLTTPYEPQNGPLESIDQLLLIRDVTPELLYGFDRNQNFQLDAAEQQMYAIENVDNSTGSMNRGWAAYLTLRSGEKNIRADGTPKIDINGDDLEALHTELKTVLDENMANFIIAYRQGGAYDEETGETTAGGSAPDAESGGGGQGGGGGRGGRGGGGDGGSAGGVAEQRKDAASLDLDYEQGGSVPINSILDVIGVQTRVVESGQTGRTIVEVAFADDPGSMQAYLPIMMENLTAGGQDVIPGRININQAPRVILDGLSMAMPTAFPPQTVEYILANRSFEPALDQPDMKYETWLLTTGVVTIDQMKQLMPLISGGGDIYRAQVVGYYEAEGPFTRLEVIVDNTGQLPTISSVRDLTPLGSGFTAEQLGVSE